MPTIGLSQGKHVLVDEDDYIRLSQHKWCFNQKAHGVGYAQRNQHIKLGYKQYKTKTVYMHREILNTELEVDHINGDTLDNRKENLRVADRIQQSQNTSSRKHSSSQYVGVHLHKLTGKWRSQIKLSGKTVSLGLFDSEEKAYNARVEFIVQNNLERFKR